MTGGIESSIIFKKIAFHVFQQSAIAFLYNHQFLSWLFVSNQTQFDVVRFNMKCFIRQPFYVKTGIEDSVYFVLCEIWETFKYNPLGVEFFQSQFRDTYYHMQAVYEWHKASFKRVMLAYWMLTFRTNVQESGMNSISSTFRR